MTEYARPRDLGEALALRAAHPGWMVLAGGTDLMVNAPRKAVPAGILDLWRLPGLGGITRTPTGYTIGAGATYREIADHAGLQAELALASAAGARRVPYREFCTGYRTTALAPDELIVAVHLPLPAAGTRLCWRKVGTRRAQSISKVMGAAAIVLDAAGRITDARIALGAVADRPIRIAAVEAAVRGLPLAEAADAARAAVAGAIAPITDVRSTTAYRLAVAENLVARFFS